MVSTMAENRCQFHVAMGGNMELEGTPSLVTMQSSLRFFSDHGLKIAAVSRFYQTPCFPAGAGPDYVNAALTVEADMKPRDVLARLHDIEQLFRRKRAQRWGMRTLDLDLIAAGDAVYPDLTEYQKWRDLSVDAQKIKAPDDLILPHPRIQDRAFVVVPLNDIAPTWRHPVSGLSVAQMLGKLSQEAISEVKPI